MSERETALFEVARVLALAALDMGANPEILRARLEKSQQDCETSGNKNGAGAIALLIRAVFGPATYQPTRPSLRVVKPDENSS